MGRTLLDQVVDTDYGQLDLVWHLGAGFDGCFERFFRGQHNGLVGAADPGGLYVNLARRLGGSHVQIVLRDSTPDDPERDWEDVVEVSTVVPLDAEPQWVAWAGDPSGPLALPPGTYRVRVSARGRDTGHREEFADAVVDHYLIELWPAPAAPDAVLRSRSADAAYWHAENGGLRYPA